MIRRDFTIRRWDRYLYDVGLQEDIIEAYRSYYIPLIQQRVPPIFGFSHLAKLLGRTERHLASLINAPDAHYRTFRIAKRTGGSREIFAPYPSLLECQRWVLDNILYSLGTSKCAHGFKPQHSIITNAQHHAGQTSIIKLDIKEFFPSVRRERVLGLFLALGYAPNVAWYLASLCTKSGVLPQGAPTSPTLSNLVSYRLDCRLNGLALKYKFRYSRYADDITFSGRYEFPPLIKFARKIIEDEGFYINQNKVQICTEPTKQVVTGLLVNGGNVRPTKQFRRNLSRDIYHVWKHGLFSHTKNRKIRNLNYIDQLYGRLQFWNLIEPENRELQKQWARFKEIQARSS